MNSFNNEYAYYLYFLIRRCEEKIIEVYDTDKIKSPVHLSIGQEAVAVGVSMALTKNEVIFSNYRGHAHYLARRGDLKKMWAELYGKSTGTARGKAGSMHLNDWKVNFMSTSAIVGTAVPEALGYAMSLKYKKIPGVVICYHGDGAVDEGVYWESLNFASLHKLPILFVCENNRYAIYTHQKKRMINDGIVDRAKSFGIKATKVEGITTEDFYNITKKSLPIIQADNEPALIECMTNRWRDHVGPGEDNHFKYRDETELANAKKNDDLLRLKKLLTKEKVFEIEKKVESEIDEAIEFAENSSFPEINEITDNVYG